jgi:hypothetical protein
LITVIPLGIISRLPSFGITRGFGQTGISTEHPVFASAKFIAR